jgi:hypothetical protein
MVGGMKDGGTLSMGVDHDNYRHSRNPVPVPIRDALRRDLD